MKPMTIGAAGTATAVVDDTNLAKTVKSGSLSVFATPMMAALMEQAACNAVRPFLEDGETTVGTELELHHDAATPADMMVTARAEVTAVCGREITFQVTASDDAGVIGSGTHKRFLVDAERFMAKAHKRGEQKADEKK